MVSGWAPWLVPVGPAGSAGLGGRVASADEYCCAAKALSTIFGAASAACPLAPFPALATAGSHGQRPKQAQPLASASKAAAASSKMLRDCAKAGFSA